MDQERAINSVLFQENEGLKLLLAQLQDENKTLYDLKFTEVSQNKEHTQSLQLVMSCLNAKYEEGENQQQISQQKVKIEQLLKENLQLQNHLNQIKRKKFKL